MIQCGLRRLADTVAVGYLKGIYRDFMLPGTTSNSLLVRAKNLHGKLVRRL
jgi:hypothetical protein